jgi:hypothetical protein
MLYTLSSYSLLTVGNDAFVGITAASTAKFLTGRATRNITSRLQRFMPSKMAVNFRSRKSIPLWWTDKPKRDPVQEMQRTATV